MAAPVAAPGYGGSVEISTDSGTTWLTIGTIDDSNIDENVTTVEVTRYSDQGNEAHYPIKRGATVTFGGVQDDSDTGYQAARDAARNLTVVDLRFREITGTGEEELESSAIITKCSRTKPHGDVIRYSIDTQLTGALTVGTQ